MPKSITSPKMPAQSRNASDPAALPAPGSKTSDLTTLLTVVGFACLLAGLIGVVFSSAFGVDSLGTDGLGQGEGALLGLCVWLGLFAAQLVSYTRYVQQSLPQRWGLRTLVFCLALSAVLLAMALPVLLQLPWPPGVLALIWFCLGVLVGLLLPIWGNTWSALDAERSDTRNTALLIAWSIVALAVLSVFLLFAPRVAALVAIWAFFMASVALVAWCTRQLPPHDPIAISLSKQHLSILSRNLLMPLVLAAILGALLCFCLLALDTFVVLSVLLACALAAALVMVLLLVLLRRVPHYSTVERWVIGVCGLAFVAFILDLQLFEPVASVVAIGSLIFYLIFHWSVLVALSYRHKVLTLYHYSQGLIAPLSGLVLGWLVMLLIFPGSTDATANVGIASIGAAVHDAKIWPLFVAFLLALLLVSCIVPFASNKDVENIFETDDPDSGEGKVGGEGGLGSAGTSASPGLQSGFWQRKLQQLSEEHKLSPREVEVFALLAKGRNADYIAKALFISTHTVKTHVYRIYRKLDVNTQQELIEKVDSLRI